MPMHGFVARDVAGNARFQIAACASSVDIAAPRKLEQTKPADPQPNPRAQSDEELVGSVWFQSREITSSVTKGLFSRSSPKVESGPWPGMKLTSSPSVQSCSVIERMSVS